MNINCILFGAINLKKEEIENKRVIEIGSCNVNGNLRPLLESYKPKEYIGIDVMAGPGVDIICDVKDLVKRFGEQSFDIVLSTELLEHVRDWRAAIHNIKTICRKGGIILITCRSFGFGYHGYPSDFWRYEVGDMEYIFSDCTIAKIERDPERGVFLKALKPENFAEKDLSGYALYSIVVNKKVRDLSEKDFKRLYFRRLVLREKLRDFLRRAVDVILCDVK